MNIAAPRPSQFLERSAFCFDETRRQYGKVSLHLKSCQELLQSYPLESVAVPYAPDLGFPWRSQTRRIQTVPCPQCPVGVQRN